MLKRFYLTYLTLGRTFGAWFSPLVTVVGFVVLWLVVSVGMALDWIFFPKLWKTRVREPIVIVGNPRTGTTFLQRWMVKHGLGAGMELWRMLYPSLTLQFILKPLLPLLEKVSPAKYHTTAAHKTGLTSVETDDPSMLFRFFDGFFLYGFFLAFADKDYQPLFDPRERDTSKRDFAWFEKIWRRNLVATGQRRVLAKVFSLSLRLPAFLQRFPDARVLYMVRDPISVVPSSMSLVTGVLDKRFGFWKLPAPTRERFLERLYAAFLELTRRFVEDYRAGRIPTDRLYVVRYDRMMQDFEGVMHEILDFVHEPLTDELEAEIRATGEKQRAYVSAHKYDLAKFGLTAERILRDYDFLYETFGLPRPTPGSGAENAVS